MTSTITSIAPPAARLDADLAAAQDAIDRAVAAGNLAGDGAHAFTRISIYCKTTEAVDAIAGELGAQARWTGSAYVAERESRGGASVEVAFFGARPAATGDAA